MAQIGYAEKLKEAVIRKHGAAPIDSQNNFIAQSPHSPAEQKETTVKLSQCLREMLSGVLRK